AVVAAVVIQGGDAPLIVDASVALRAEVRDARQQVLSDRTVDWSSSDADVLTVDQTGRVSARSAGSADVIASSEGVQGRVTIVVEAAPPAAPEPPTTAEVSAEADRYVALLNANAEDQLRALFGADAEAEGSRDLLGRLRWQPKKHRPEQVSVHLGIESWIRPDYISSIVWSAPA
ncbi:MAG: Ig-like domain-containing protein, partial [Proteobacteria bacterium]|nr:Ig-like domain-containing protein [Pseudomonadota bacterium]